MRPKKRHWFWNLLLALSVVLSILAFAAHWKVWKQIHPDRIRFLSGMYYLEISNEALQRVEWADKLPQMEREHGFSAGARENGIFRDSLHPESKVYVMVDNLRRPKIRVAFSDSLLLYLNFADSLETEAVFQWIEARMDSLAAGPGVLER